MMRASTTAALVAVVVALAAAPLCRGEPLTVDQVCGFDKCMTKEKCLSIVFDYEPTNSLYAGFTKGGQCCKWHDEPGALDCENAWDKDLLCTNSSDVGEGILDSECIGGGPVAQAIVFDFGSFVIIIVVQVTVVATTSAVSGAAAASSSASSSSSSSCCDCCQLDLANVDLPGDGAGDALKDLMDSVDTEIDLDDISGSATVNLPAVGRCRLVLDKPHPESEGPLPDPKKYKPKFVLPLPYSLKTDNPIDRLPSKVGKCCSRRKVPRKAIDALEVPVGNAELWAKISAKATEIYLQTPLRNDMKRRKIMKAMTLATKLKGALGLQGVIGQVLAISSGGSFSPVGVVMLLLTLGFMALEKLIAKMRKENYEESQKAVEEYVNNELTTELHAQGLHCMYALEKRKTVTFSFSCKAKFMDSIGKGTEVKSPVIFISNEPVKPDTLFSKAEKLFKVASKAKAALEMHVGGDAEDKSEV